jgi:hypothetical protein
VTENVDYFLLQCHNASTSQRILVLKKVVLQSVLFVETKTYVKTCVAYDVEMYYVAEIDMWAGHSVHLPNMPKRVQSSFLTLL